MQCSDVPPLQVSSVLSQRHGADLHCANDRPARSQQAVMKKHMVLSELPKRINFRVLSFSIVKGVIWGAEINAAATETPMSLAKANVSFRWPKWRISDPNCATVPNIGYFQLSGVRLSSKVTAHSMSTCTRSEL